MPVGATTPYNNVKGIVAILIATVFGTACDVVTRLALEQDYALAQVLFARGMMTLVLLTFLVAAVGAWRNITAAVMNPLVLVRSIFDISHVVLVVTAISTIPLAIATAGLTTLPIWLTLLSFLMREQVGWRRWLAVIVGFCGMFLIVKPDTTAFNYFTLIAIGSGLAAAARDVVTPRIDKSLSPWLLTFVSVVMITAATMPLSLPNNWRPITPYVSLLLAAGGLFQISSMYWIITGFRSGEVSVIAPFRFVLLIWALIAGYFIFGEVIDAMSLTGVVLIVAAGIYTLWREAVLRKAKTIPLSASPVPIMRGADFSLEVAATGQPGPAENID
jgi:drug/metabolite transporter (DMT)-like permease